MVGWAGVERKSDIASAILGQRYSEINVGELVRQAEAYGYSRTRDVGPWQLYVLGQQFFAAGRKGGGKEYAIIQGQAPIEAVQSDLEKMANGMLKGGNWLYTTFVRASKDDRKFRGTLLGGLFYLCGFGGALISPASSGILRGMLVIGALGGAFVAYFGVKAAGAINDRRVTKGLSEQAISYNYGWGAEEAISEKYDELVQSKEKGLTATSS